MEDDGERVIEQLLDSCKNGRADEFKTLIEQVLSWGADLNHPFEIEGKPRTLLRIALEHGHEALVPILLAAGASPLPLKLYKVDADTERLVEQLLDACKHGRADEFRTLLGKALALGADVNAPIDSIGQLLLQVTLQYGHEALVPILLAAGADPNRKGWGSAALPLACSKGLMAAIGPLLEAGADPNVRDDRYIFPLQHAVIDGNAALVTLLVKKGADVRARSDAHSEHGTALHSASRHGRADMVALLLELGADIHAFMPLTSQHISWDRSFGTPLHAACKVGHEGIVRLLLERGARFTAGGEEAARDSERGG